MRSLLLPPLVPQPNWGRCNEKKLFEGMQLGGRLDSSTWLGMGYHGSEMDFSERG
jgi:hypothetical protein